jgi:hypothetical protein
VYIYLRNSSCQAYTTHRRHWRPGRNVYPVGKVRKNGIDPECRTRSCATQVPHWYWHCHHLAQWRRVGRGRTCVLENTFAGNRWGTGRTTTPPCPSTRGQERRANNSLAPSAVGKSLGSNSYRPPPNRHSHDTCRSGRAGTEQPRTRRDKQCRNCVEKKQSKKNVSLDSYSSLYFHIQIQTYRFV